MNSLINDAKEKLNNGIDLMLVRIIDSTGGAPRTKDAFMFVDCDSKSYGTIGGGRVEYEATINAKDLLMKKTNSTKNYNLTMEAAENLGMVCGGNINVEFVYLTNNDKSLSYLDELDKKTRNNSKVYIFGAGHVSMELAKVLDYLDYEVIIWDNREEFANVNRFPTAKKVICDEYNDIIKNIDIKKEDFAVIMTRGHVSDYTCLTQILNTDIYYIGVIGSSDKNKFVKEKALNEGFKEEDFKKVHAPIGIQIGAETPEEIAISIASEIILFKSKMENRRKVVAGKTLIDTCINYK